MSILGINSLNKVPNNYYSSNKAVKSASGSICGATSYAKGAYYKPINFCANFTPEDKKKYDFLLNFMKNYKVSKTSGNLKVNQQLDKLLKNGILLSKNAKDKSSILDNLYEIATVDRAYNLDKQNLISNVLDIILNPAVVTQNFGDIPASDKEKILSNLPFDNPIKSDPSLMDITASGTCVAASCEVNLADKYPAEFARWVNKLSSTDKEFYSKIKLSSISKNKLEALEILNLLCAKTKKFNFDYAEILIKPDDYAYIRAKNQDKNWDFGERNVADVLVQCAIMQLGSQGTYDSLTDTRAGDFSANPQGLVEIEKTFVESVIKDKEINSVVHQQIDDDKHLIGYNSSFEKLKGQINRTLDSNEDVILGYVLTNESAGLTSNPSYNPLIDGEPNKVINGHEITIVGYRVDENNETIYTCIDTDDEMSKRVEYSASWLIPKINHAGIPANN